MPTLTPNPTYEKRPIWEVVVNTIGGAIETLWPGNWIGASVVQSASTGVKNPATGTSGYPWIKSSQLTPAIELEDQVDPVDLLPVIVGTVVATFFILRK